LQQVMIRSGALHELKIYRRALGISHLLFAYDTLLFVEANEQHTRVVHDVLRRYEEGTGQLINPSKCSIMFEKGCRQANQDKVKEVLHVTNVAEDEKI
jgi:hypothetical protein